jgi:C-terminal processing protease CtpA/Prc
MFILTDKDMKQKKIFYVLSLLLITAMGCNKDDDSENVNNAGLSDSQKVNKFIVDCVSDLYLWEADTDWKKYATSETYSAYPEKDDHFTLFDKFINKDDRWSFLTDDIEEMQEQISGVTTSYGYDLVFGSFDNRDGEYFAIVLYTFKGSPADKAGLRRGDFITMIDGGAITQNNYAKLFNSASIQLTLGHIEDSAMKDEPTAIAMTAVQMTDVPINKDTILVEDSHKIGYICYTGYSPLSSEGDLKRVFTGFKDAGVTDVVLDLRYNGGGYASLAQALASILAPASAVKSKDIYLTRQWNAAYMQYIKDGKISNDEYFIDTLSVNMNLSRLYVLATGNTASASEATIIGLKPYMDVKLIGETTHGKYVGAYMMGVEDYYDSSIKYQYAGIANWGMYIMIYRYSNKAGYPTFVGGLPADYPAEEDYLDLKPFGDETDPLLAKAIEQITGERPANTLSSKPGKVPAITLHPEMMPRKKIMVVEKRD